VLGKPARRFGFRDDSEDFDDFARDVIEHPHFPNPEAILRLAQAPQPFDAALAHPSGLVPQVPLEGAPHFGPAVILGVSLPLRNGPPLVVLSRLPVLRQAFDSRTSVGAAESAGRREPGLGHPTRSPMNGGRRRGQGGRGSTCANRARPQGNGPGEAGSPVRGRIDIHVKHVIVPP